jgi:penicillin-binding protein 1A
MQDNLNSQDNGDTRDFDKVPQSNETETNGGTKIFDTVETPETKANGKSKNTQQTGNSKTAKAAKNTFMGVVFVARKVLTYLLNVLLTVLLVGIITGTVVVIAFVAYIKNYVDPNYTGLDNLKFESAISTTMYYVDDTGNEILLEKDTLESSENRMWADYADIPQDLIDAYIAVEDMRFFEHNGVDTTRTASAIYNFFIPTSSNYGGGSTITQQLIKNVSKDNEATIQRKVQEIFRAFNVETKYSKEDILEMYLNTIFLSRNSYGVRVAAETYFGKSLEELNLTECAAIASIGKSPTKYDPVSNPNNNLVRRNLVLKLMLEQGMITDEEFNEAYDKPLTLKDGTQEGYNENVHSYYIDAVMDDVIADLMEEYGYDEATASRMLYSGGLQIVTCLDPVIQDCAEKVYTDSAYWPETNGMQAQSSICIMDQKTGDILALVGGLGEKRESRGLNRATQTRRQCGSSIKPLSIYAYALDTGYYHAGSPVDDVPPVYNETTGRYWPSGTYRGLVSLDYAIRVSLNTVPVKAAMNLMEIPVGECRLPLYPMEERALDALAQVLRRHQLIK